MNSVSPVYTEKEVESERVLALDQPQYYPIIVARVAFEDGYRITVCRFRFTEEERAAIANGADLLISQPHHMMWMPLGLQLAMPGEYPTESR